MGGQYGFMEIEDRDDAEDAIKDINGKSFNGGRIKVEFSHAYSGNDRDRRSGGRGGRDFDRDRGGSRRVSDGKFRRTNYRLVVQNISSGTSWQDLKDHMKQAGEIIYSTVNRNNAREGLVEFKHKEDMERALDELDDSKLDGRRIKLVEEQRSPSRSRSRSGRRERRRSESKSVSRSRAVIGDRVREAETPGPAAGTMKTDSVVRVKDLQVDPNPGHKKNAVKIFELKI